MKYDELQEEMHDYTDLFHTEIFTSFMTFLNVIRPPF